MDPFQLLKSRLTGILDELAEAGALPHGLDHGRVNVEPPRDTGHGDVVRLTDARPPEWRLRVGDRRVFFRFRGDLREIHLLRVRRRDEAYR